MPKNQMHIWLIPLLLVKTQPVQPIGNKRKKNVSYLTILNYMSIILTRSLMQKPITAGHPTLY